MRSVEFKPNIIFPDAHSAQFVHALIVNIHPFKSALWPGVTVRGFLDLVFQPAGNFTLLALVLIILLLQFGFFLFGFCFGILLAMAGPGVANGFHGSSQGRLRGIMKGD